MQPKTVLIADDDRDLVHVLKIRCNHLNLNVVSAHDAMTALALAHEHRPDLICLDVNMPSGSGLSVCEMLAADDRLSSIPVIMLTGQADEETIRRCHAMCAYYVLKSRDIWDRVEPILRELLQLPAADADPQDSTESAPVATGTSRHDLGKWRRQIASEVIYSRVGTSASDVPV
jgi:CheY-like chemotaxis protein